MNCCRSVVSVRCVPPSVRPSGRVGWRASILRAAGLSSEAERAKEFSPTRLVGTDTPGFGMLGVGVEGDAGDVKEGGFFGNVARVGDDAPCLIDEEPEVQVALWRQDVQVRGIQSQ